MYNHNELKNSARVDIMLQKLFRIFNYIVFRYFTRTTIHGIDSAKQIEGGLVLTANHLGFLDGFMIYYVTWREDVIVPVAEHWQDQAWSRLLVKAMNAIFVDRYNADVSAVRETLRRLRKGGMLCLAPEGTRSRTGGLAEPRDGAAYLAMKVGVPVVPVAFTGTEDPYVIDCFKHFRRPVINLTFGEPFMPPKLPKENRDEAVAAFSEEIMLRIAALLPESYRGVFVDHPRMKEFENLASRSSGN